MKTLTSLIALNNNHLSVSFDKTNVPLPVNKIHAPMSIGITIYYMYQHPEDGLEFDLG